VGSLTYHVGDVQTLSSGTRLRVARRKCADFSGDLASSIIMFQKTLVRLYIKCNTGPRYGIPRLCLLKLFLNTSLFSDISYI
jgi:hypothetical protein